ncbi:MAG: TIGR03761 family integrating conjugative element protein [Gammaproteobacteria bacterium]|nr:TIGR03761 family integrating conjugative element protein [Gammaproteobacteria bacterium]
MNQQATEIPRTDPDSRTVPSPEADRPGVLRGVVTLTLETRQAQRLVKGRPGTPDKPAIIGLIGFANLLRAIWHGVRAEDPYADWWLLKVHDALEAADQALAAASETVETGLNASAAIRATPAASVRPTHTPLRFSNPYAFRGAQLVAAYDRLVRAVLTARHIGIITADDGERTASLGGRALRRAFQSPLGYRPTGLTREEVLQGTARATEARAQLGTLPEAVIAGTRRAPHGPLRPMPESATSRHLDLHAQAPRS